MKDQPARAMFLMATILFLALEVAHADLSVTFPSDNSFSCNANVCTFLGSNFSQSAPLFTAGDFVSEVFINGPTSIAALQYDFFLNDNLGGNPGASYENDVYVNSTLVGNFLVADCGYCGTTQEYKGTFTFPSLVGNGTYSLAIVLLDTVPLGGGNEVYLAPGSATLVEVPEPSSLLLLGAGLVGTFGAVRRKLLG